MRIVVSIPDEMFQRLNELAIGLGKSRSQFCREALAEDLLGHAPRLITAVLDELVESLGEG